MIRVVHTKTFRLCLSAGFSTFPKRHSETTSQILYSKIFITLTVRLQDGGIFYDFVSASAAIPTYSNNMWIQLNGSIDCPFYILFHAYIYLFICALDDISWKLIFYWLCVQSCIILSAIIRLHNILHPNFLNTE